MIGVAQGAFDYAVGYAYERKQFGKYIGEFSSPFVTMDLPLMSLR